MESEQHCPASVRYYQTLLMEPRLTSSLKLSERFTLICLNGEIYFILFIFITSLISNPEVELADVEAVLDYMEKVSKNQKGFVNPANFKAPDCPKL